MLRFAITVLAVTALVAGDALPTKLQKLRPHGRIVGGDEVTIEDNPWQVSVQPTGYHSCGGSIISPNAILTTVQCTEEFNKDFYEIISGTTDLLKNGTISTVKRFIPHEKYDGLSYDIALIILDEPLAFNEKIQPVPLAEQDPANGDLVKVTGWGVLNDTAVTMPTTLRGVDVNIVNRTECARDYANLPDATVDNNMICAGVPGGGKDACLGDIGGPLTKDGVLVGIVSWGYRCAQPAYPGVYTSIATFRKWIKKHSGV